MSVSQIEWPANGKRKAPSFSSKHSDLPSSYFMPIVIFKQDFGSAEGMPVNNQYVVCWKFLRTVHTWSHEPFCSKSCFPGLFMTSVFHGSKGCQFKSLVILVTPVQRIQTFPTDSFSSPVNGAWN